MLLECEQWGEQHGVGLARFLHCLFHRSPGVSSLDFSFEVVGSP